MELSYDEPTDPGRQRRAMTVSELSAAIKYCLEETFPAVWVSGEITDISQPQSGHIYFCLKDETAQIRGVVWRSTAQQLPFRVEEGMAVLALGQVQVYMPRGSYQLVVRQLEPQGIGALQIAFRQLHKKLSDEGLFDAARKKRLPKFPQRIGFVTSPSGAAIRDFLEVARRRWHGVQVTIIPARVQGPGAAQEIAAGIRAAERLRPRLDALVVGRGGGSVEDLWCFNEEVVVRAIAACSLPTVSAVGHEVDVTLADLAADQRALTPTEAAERLLPAASDVRQLLSDYAQRMLRPLWHRVELLKSRLEMLGRRPVMVQPLTMLNDRRRLLDELDQRAQVALDRQRERCQQRMNNLAGKLHALSPLAVLGRGYSVTESLESGECISTVRQLAVGETIRSRVQDGSITSRVESIEVR